MKIFINTIIDDLLIFHESNVSFGYKERIKLERNLFLLLSEFLELEFNYQLKGFTNYYNKEILKIINRESNPIHYLLVNKIFETKYTIQGLSSDNSYLRDDTLSKVGLRKRSHIYKSIAIQIVKINNCLNRLKIIDVAIDRNSTIKRFNNYKTFYLSIPIPSDLKKQFNLYQSGIQKKNIAKWVDPEKLHITLLYLGKVNINYIEDIQVITKSIVENYENIKIYSKNIQLIETKYSRLIWLVIDENKKLHEMHEKLKSGLRKYIQEESTTYKPHITLAYDYISEENLLIAKEIYFSFNLFEIQLIEKQDNEDDSKNLIWDSIRLSDFNY